jgi:hypothetical protein
MLRNYNSTYHPEFESAVCNTSSRCFSAAAYCLFLSSIAKAARALSWIIATHGKCKNNLNKVLYYSQTKTNRKHEKYEIPEASLGSSLESQGWA